MATRYAVATGSWDSTASWSATSGGAAGASVPGNGDSVIFDHESGGVVVTLDQATEIDGLTFSNASTGQVAFNGQNLSVNGNVTLLAGKSNLGDSGSTASTLVLLSNFSTFTTAGEDIGLINVRIGASFSFVGNLTARNLVYDASASYTVTHAGGGSYTWNDIDFPDAGIEVLSLVSNNPTQQYSYNFTGAPSAVRSTDVTDCNSDTAIDATDGSNNNGGNNINWFFSAGSLTTSSTSETSTSNTPSTSTSTTETSSSNTSLSETPSTLSTSSSLSNTPSTSTSTSTSSPTSPSSNTPSTSTSTSSTSDSSTSTSTSPTTLTTSTSTTSTSSDSSTSTSSDSTATTSSSSTSSDSTATSSSDTSTSSSNTPTTSTSTTSTSISDTTTSSTSTSTETSATTSPSTSSSDSSTSTSQSSSSTLTTSSTTSTSTSISRSESTSTSDSSSSSSQSDSETTSSTSTSTSSNTPSTSTSTSTSTSSESSEDLAPWDQLCADIAGILERSPEVEKWKFGSLEWKRHIFCDIREDLSPPRNGLAAIIIEIDTAMDMSRGANDADDYQVACRIRVTDSRIDRSEPRSRSIMYDITRALQNGLDTHRNKFSFGIPTILNQGRFRFVEVIGSFLIVDETNR